MKVMSGLDRRFMGMESEWCLMDNVGIFVLDPTTAPDRHDFDRVRTDLAASMPRVPAFVRRPVEVPNGLGPPCWAVDPDFSIENHVHRIAAPSPGGLRELSRLTLDLFDEPLRRDRPMWELWYVEGVENGGAAILLRVHHAALDGMGGMQMINEIFDEAPLPFEARKPPAVTGERIPSAPEMWLRAIPSAIRNPLDLTRSIASLVATQIPALLPSAKDARRSSTSRSSGRESSEAPVRTVFNRRPETPRRSHAVASVRIADLIRLKDAFGVTFNDVVLAVVAGAIRGYLASRDELPDVPLRTACPVNVRDEDSTADEGNQFVFMVVDLPTHLADPVERIAAIHASTSASSRVRARERHGESSRPSTMSAVMGVIDALPATAWSAVGLLMPSPAMTAIPPIFNLAMSNIRGPTRPLYLSGARITHLYGRTMVGPGVGLFIHCLSYGETLDFGVMAFHDLVPDADALAAGLAEELERLEAAASR